MNPSRMAWLLGLIVVIAPGAQSLRADSPASILAEPGKVAIAELPLGAIKPTGWLKAQLRIQAEGLSGHLDEFWPDIKNSSWIGGRAEGWERTPYWLDGIVPLAYLLDDAQLKAKAQRYIDYILDHQQPDGWLGPIGDSGGHKPYDVWPLFVLFKAFTQYEEATHDPRIVPALLRCSKKIDEVVTKEPLYEWAYFRGADLVVSLHWLHAKTGDASLLPLIAKINQQSYDWRKHSRTFTKYQAKQTQFGLDNHGVNTGMGLKFGVMRSLTSRDPKDATSLDQNAGHARPVSRPGGGSVQLRRAPRRPEPVARHRALHRGRGDVLARTRRKLSSPTPSSATGSKNLPSTPSPRPSRKT